MQESKENKRFCAFLRGVNVKGTSMKMVDVCSLFEKAGMSEVVSVLASGNIIFSSNLDRNELKPLLEKVLSEHYNYEAFLFLSDKKAIGTYLQNIPFEINPDFHIYGFVGIDGIEQTLNEEFQKTQKVESETAILMANHFYWQVEKGNTLASEFGKILGRKNLKDAFTSRNLNTFEKIYKKM